MCWGMMPLVTTCVNLFTAKKTCIDQCRADIQAYPTGVPCPLCRAFCQGKLIVLIFYWKALKLFVEMAIPGTSPTFYPRNAHFRQHFKSRASNSFTAAGHFTYRGFMRAGLCCKKKSVGQAIYVFLEINAFN